MSTVKKKRNRRQNLLLSSTRPRLLRSVKPSHPLPSFASRTVIRTHHTLHKRLTAAISRQDANAADAIKAEIESLGGLEKYQDASLAGQSKERGGDTSGVLVQWLGPYSGRSSELRLLEVGALSVDNACARSKIFGGGVERIDLKSRHPYIKEENFMDRPLPDGETDLFDVVSLSLVVNYLGDPQGRGEMLRRVADFLRTRTDSNQRSGKIRLEKNDGAQNGSCNDNVKGMEDMLPALFLVLPAPCVNNSRYLDEERLKAILSTLGFGLIKRKMSSKLVYYLWKYQGLKGGERQRSSGAVFKKDEIRKGKDRNNFAIVLA